MNVAAPVNDQWNYLLSTIWDQMIHLVIRFDGHLDETRLDAAIEGVVDAEPLITMCYTETEAPYYRPMEQEMPPLIYSVIRTGDRDAALQTLLSRPTDPLTGPMARIRLIRSDVDLLCISVNHTISDAYGVKSLGSLIARLYRAQAAPSSFRPLKNSHNRSFAGVLRLLPKAVRHEALVKFGEQQGVWNIPVRSFVKTNPEYRSVSIAPEILSTIKTRARESGVTVNDILLSAYFLTLTEFVSESEEKILPVLTSIDLRRYLSPDSFPSLANLSVAFEVPLATQTGTSLSHIVLQVHDAMTERKIGHAGIGAAEQICENFSAGYCQVKELLARSARETSAGQLPKNPFFSNLGVIPDSVLDYGGLSVTEAFMLPPVEYPPGLGLAASTCQGSLLLSTGFCSHALPSDMASSILEQMAEHLSRW
ncbi:MAG: condensation domain-containing protein [Methanoregulaceae archaeon]|nr:condensation domain-containing protein [Methanoregulaceae archaeon]